MSPHTIELSGVKLVVEGSIPLGSWRQMAETLKHADAAKLTAVD